MAETRPINEAEINELIRQPGIQTNAISDGYHTFEELYDHRIELFITLCRWLCKSDKHVNFVWRSKKNSDGSEWQGWFLLGINQHAGEQITYHLPMSRWDDCNFVDDTFDLPAEFDGHTGNDVLQRLKTL